MYIILSEMYILDKYVRIRHIHIYVVILWVTYHTETIPRDSQQYNTLTQTGS